MSKNKNKKYKKLNIKIPHGSIGVYCADEDCNCPSIDRHGNKQLLCKKHYVNMKEDLEEGRPSPFIIPHDQQKLDIMINSFQRGKIKGKDIDKTHLSIEYCHLWGFIPSRNDLTLVMGKSSVDPKFKKRVSDLKVREGRIVVVGYKKDPISGRIVELYARKDYVPPSYFGSSVLDDDDSVLGYQGIVKCGSCHRPKWDEDHHTEIGKLIDKIKKEGTSEGKKLIKMLFPNN